jgi:hypothetical protein
MKKDKRAMIYTTVIYFGIVWITAFIIILYAALGILADNFTSKEIKNTVTRYIDEWLDGTVWYIKTQTNRDRVGGWNTHIAPLEWEYILNFDTYVLSAWKEEPIHTKFWTLYRTIHISNKDGNNQKKVVKVSVIYDKINGKKLEIGRIVPNTFTIWK